MDPKNLGVWIRHGVTCSPSLWEMEEGGCEHQGQPWLQREFKASLCYADLAKTIQKQPKTKPKLTNRTRDKRRVYKSLLHLVVCGARSSCVHTCVFLPWDRGNQHSETSLSSFVIVEAIRGSWFSISPSSCWCLTLTFPSLCFHIIPLGYYCRLMAVRTEGVCDLKVTRHYDVQTKYAVTEERR